MRFLLLSIGLSATAAVGQNLVLVNSGLSTATFSSSAVGGNQVLLGTVGSPFSINVLRTDSKVVHHGLEHPLILKDKKQVYQVTIFPNPTRGPVTIAITGDGAKVLPQGIAVIDAAGKVALEMPFSNQIDLSSLSAGAYLLQFNSQESNIQSKPIVLVK